MRNGNISPSLYSAPSKNNLEIYFYSDYSNGTWPALDCGYLFVFPHGFSPLLVCNLLKGIKALSYVSKYYIKLSFC